MVWTLNRRLIAAVVMMLALMATACGSSDSAAKSDPVVIGVPGLGGEILDYTRPSGYTNAVLAKAMYTDYAYVDANGKYQPALGTLANWKSNPEMTRWEVTLKDGIKWQDESPMTAADIVFGIRRMQRPEINDGLENAPFLESLAVVQQTGPLTAVVTFKEPFPLFLYYLNLVPAVPKDYIESVGDEVFSTEKPIGNGPFELSGFKAGQSYQFTRFDDYFGGAAEFGKLTIRIIPEASTLVAALRSGEIDVATSLQGPSLSEAEGSDNLKVISVDTGVQAAFVFADRQKKSSPLSDVRVRRAIDLAIDRKGISEALFNGLATPALPYPAQPNALGIPSGLEPTGFDPERAKALLAEAGYAKGFPEPLQINTYQSGSAPYLIEQANAIATNLQAVGITAKVKVWDPGKYIPTYIDGGLSGLALLGVAATGYDVGADCFIWCADGNGLSWMTDQDTTALWNRQLTEADSATRKRDLEQAVTTMAEDERIGAVVRLPSVFVVGRRVKDFPRTARQFIVTDGIEELTLR